MTTPMERIALLETETQNLKSYVSSMPKIAWQAPSPCEGWSVGDVIGHVGWASEFFSDAISGGMEGLTATPPGLPDSGSIPVAELPAYIADRAVEYRKAADELLAEAFSSSVDRLTSVFQGVREADLDKTCYGLRAEQPLRNYIATRINEVVIHGWDIRYPSDPNAGISEQSLPVILERAPLWLAGLGLADYRPTQSPARHRFVATGAVSDQQDVVADAQGGRMDPPREQPDVTLTGEASILALLIWGRLGVRQVVADGRLVVTGDQAKADEFVGWLAVE